MYLKSLILEMNKLRKKNVIWLTKVYKVASSNADIGTRCPTMSSVYEAVESSLSLCQMPLE